MKRLLFAFFCAAIVSHLPAQAKLGDYTMRGAASQEMAHQGLVGAHPSLPIDSKVKITNPKNGIEAEITIIERIDPSLNRIIDLSAAAANVLQLKAGEQVVVTVTAPPRPITQTSRQQEPIIDLMEPVLVTQDTRQPAAVEYPNTQKPLIGQEPVVREQQGGEQANKGVKEIASGQNSQALPNAQSGDSYYPDFTLSDPTVANALLSGANSGDPEFLAWLMAMTIEAREAREARDAREAREARELREIREEREIRETRAAREAREARELREAREAKESKERREAAALKAAAQTPPPPPAANQIPHSPLPTPHSPPSSKPAINLPHTEKQNRDTWPLNLNMLEPVSAVPQGSESPSSNLRVSSNQSNVVNNQPVQRQEPPPQVKLEPVKPEALQIIPSLPDRHSGKTYKLQIGAYSSQDTANKTAAILKNSGFQAEIEYSGAVYRVFAAKIAAFDVYSASVRLGSLGFGQIWVKE